MAEYREKGIAALIFDFDGTLAVPSLDFSVMRRAAVLAMEEYVDVPDRPDLPTMELLALVGTATDAARTARKAALAAVRNVEIDAAGRSSLFPFVRPMLARLKDCGLAMAIVTRNCPEAVAAVFPDAAEHGPVLTRDDVPRVKPDPDHLIAALTALHTAPSRALMVGDHAMDVETGKRAKTLTAAVASGEHSLERLAACDPDYLAADGGELMRLLGIL
jgi:phosphoglycolate phosphatase